MRIDLSLVTPRWGLTVRVGARDVELLAPSHAQPGALDPSAGTYTGPALRSALAGCVRGGAAALAGLTDGQCAHLYVIWSACQQVQAQVLGQSVAQMYLAHLSAEPETASPSATSVTTTADAPTTQGGEDPELARLLDEIDSNWRAGCCQTLRRPDAVRLEPGKVREQLGIRQQASGARQQASESGAESSSDRHDNHSSHAEAKELPYVPLDALKGDA